MRIERKRNARYFQMGGQIEGGEPMPTEEPGMEGGGDPGQELEALLMDALQNGNCESAMGACELLVALMQQGQGDGGGEPMPEEPQFMRQGGKLTSRY